MTSVHLLTEDKTGGGLAAVIRSAASQQRQQLGKAPLHFSGRPSKLNGNAELLKHCGMYESYRFRSPRYDHVFYVIDARNVWDLLGLKAPQPPYSQSLPAFVSTIRGKMAALACGQRTEQQWAEIERGFHAHVLVWERESLILPVADRLGLGEAVLDVYAERQAAEVVDVRFRGPGRRKKYDKAIDGPELLGRIARDREMLSIVLTSNPSLRAIVEDLVSL